MTAEEVIAFLEEHSRKEYLKFDRVEDPISKRPDLHGFYLLDKIVPGDSDIVSGAEHDVAFVDVSAEALAEANVTEAQLIDLLRCGVSYSDEYDCLIIHA